MSWVEELANGRIPEGFVDEQGQPRRAPPAVLQQAQGPAQPRVCLAHQSAVNTPVAQYTEIKPACGQPQRQTDRMATDPELVTCPLCQQLVRDAQGLVAPDEGSAAALSVTPPPVVSGSLGGDRGQKGLGGLLANVTMSDVLEALLVVSRLEEEQRRLEGELEAVKLFLKAAKARQARLDVIEAKEVASGTAAQRSNADQPAS